MSIIWQDIKKVNIFISGLLTGKFCGNKEKINVFLQEVIKYGKLLYSRPAGSVNPYENPTLF